MGSILELSLYPPSLYLCDTTGSIEILKPGPCLSVRLVHSFEHLCSVYWPADQRCLELLGCIVSSLYHAMNHAEYVTCFILCSKQPSVWRSTHMKLNWRINNSEMNYNRSLKKPMTFSCKRRSWTNSIVVYWENTNSIKTFSDSEAQYLGEGTLVLLITFLLADVVVKLVIDKINAVIHKRNYNG